MAINYSNVAVVHYDTGGAVSSNLHRITTMSNLIYQCSKPVFVHHLKNLSQILKMAAKDARTRGIEPAVLLNARLSPDMFPLTRQVQIVTDHAKGCCSRLAGAETPSYADTEVTFAELDARIKRTLSFLAELKASQFVGAEDRTIVLQLPIGTLSFSGVDYLNGWALPNFYFHYAAAYNILRHNGVDVGKANFLGVMPGVQMTGKIAKMMGGKSTAKGGKKR
jgi:uncharacterized protein